ncbi:tetratricopeptide repeat protein [Thermostilla marina]
MRFSNGDMGKNRTPSRQNNPRPTASRFTRRRWWIPAVGVVVLLVGGSVFLDWYICLPAGLEAHYVGRDKCIDCHRQEYDLWHGSDHDMAMDRADESTVLGDFDDAHFIHIAFADLHKLPEDELRLLVENCDDETLAVSLLPYEPEEADLILGPGESGEPSRRAILSVLSPDRRAQIEELRDWRAQFARPCDITTAHQQLDDVARRLADEGKIHPDFAVRSRMFRRNGKFYVETDNAEGKLETFRVDYVFGIWPLQQYLVSFPDGRIQCLPIAWDTENKRWFHLYPSEPIPARDPLHWTGEFQTWNYMCAECHTTNLEKNYDLAADRYHTTWSEIDVSCEQCHGPGSIHVQLAESNSLFWDRRYKYGLPELDPADQRQIVESCAPCHSRRRIVAPDFRPGDKFLDHYIAEFLEGNLYYDDGQIKDEDYVYGSFIQSLMYRKGVRCIDCHDPHTARIKFADPDNPREKYVDNRLCGQCHTPAKYDTPNHHHHPKTGEPGSHCVECHMPETTYMVVDPRRDHSLRIPRPDLTIALGIPNACNGCHQDPDKGETPEWAARTIEEWYGKKPDEHFAVGFHAAKQDDPKAIPKLLDVLRAVDNAGQVRGTAVLLLSRFDAPAARAGILSAVEDKDPLVRAAAARALRSLPPDPQYVDRVKPLLDDPIRAVRVEAVPWLVNFRDRLDTHYRRLLDKAIDEYIVSQNEVADRAGSHVNLAVLYLALGKADKAVDEYRHAVRIDPDFLPARNNLSLLYADLGRFNDAERELKAALERDPNFLPAWDNLARLYYRQGRYAEAEASFRKLIEKAPDNGEARFSLGLLLAENPERMREAAEMLREASRLMPQNARVFYNLGLMLQHLKELEDAETALRKAARLAPRDPQTRQALLFVLVDRGKWEEAAAMAEQLFQENPSPATKAIWEAIRARRDPRTPGG